MAWAVPLFLLLLPLWVITAGQLRHAHFEAFMAGGLLLLAVRITNPWVRAWLGLNAFAMLATLLVLAMNPGRGTLYVHQQAVEACMWMMFGGVVYLAAGWTSPRRIARACLIMLGAQLAVVAIQSLGVNPVMILLRSIHPGYLDTSNGKPLHQLGGTLGNPDFISVLVALCLPFAWLLWGCRTYVIASILAGIFVATQGATTGMLALVAGMAALALADRRLWAPLALLAGASLVWAVVADNAWREIVGQLHASGAGARMIVWRRTVEGCLGAWIMGHGPGTWGAWFVAARAPVPFLWSHAHNEFLEVWFEYGAVGLVLVAGFVWSLLSRAWSLRHDRDIAALGAVVVAACVSSAGLFTMHLAPLAAVVLASAGSLDSETGWKRA